MNIFWLDTDLETNAKYHCDKHVCKMPTEYAQMLSVVARENGFENSYKPTHQNHPCTRWAAKSGGNYTLLYDIAIAVSKEYTFRYGKYHKAHQFIEENLPRVLNPGEVPIRTPLPNCTTFKEPNPNINLVDRYRMFYIRDKAHILFWKNREEPWFVGDRFYKQQIDTIGTCPGYAKELSKKIKKPTKEHIANEIGCPNLVKLTVADLEKVCKVEKSADIEIPEGRLKKPYIDQCNQHLDSSVGWNKLTVNDLVATLKFFKNY